jgi:exopolysaccharide biosynthesis polyprenyl glycosylphosphotransferase
MLAKKIKIGLILLTDLVSFSLALILMILIRYGFGGLKAELRAHLAPFALLFILWGVIFYLCNLYSYRSFKNKIDLARAYAAAVSISFIVSIVAFYAAGGIFGLTPKTNLVIFTIIFAVLNLALRMILGQVFVLRKFLVKIILIGDSPSIRDTVSAIEKYPEMGFQTALWIKDGAEASIREIMETIKKDRAEIVVLGKSARQDKATLQLAYNLIPSGIEIADFADFYESIYRKVPLDELGEEWFIEEIKTRQGSYDFIKRAFDIVLSLALLVILLPLGIVIAALIWATSPGGAIYSQRRVGRNGKEFTLYKFRTMKIDAEKDGAKWAQANDARTTKFGKALRATHLDEMPQLANILSGDLSFVGPRPERPEFTSVLKSEIPYYEIRHTILPGLTGWAQINYRYGSTAADAVEKLKYELYYHHSRSIVFDILILIKTIRMVFQNH